MTIVEIVAGPVSSGMVSGTMAIESPASALAWPSPTSEPRLSACCALSMFIDEISSSRPPPTWNEAMVMPKNSMICRPATALIATTSERRDRRHADRALALLARQVLREVQEERNRADRVDDGQQGHERFEQVQIHAAILAAAESIRATKFRSHVLDERRSIAGKPVGSNPAEMRETGLFHLESGGFTAPKRQNNNFLDCALHFVIC